MPVASPVARYRGAVTGAQVHSWTIDQREYDRHEERRGRRHAYEHLDPSRTALVVIDMVPFFVDDQPYAACIVDPVAGLADALRAAGGVVAWVIPATELAVKEEFLGSEIAARYRGSGGVGPLAERLCHGLTPGDGDLAVEKDAPSAFFPGRCDLDPMLRARGVDTVLISGTVANVCCESSARDASTLGYRVVMVADATAANTDAELNATLHTIYRSFGDVRPTSEIIELIER